MRHKESDLCIVGKIEIFNLRYEYRGLGLGLKVSII